MPSFGPSLLLEYAFPTPTSTLSTSWSLLKVIWCYVRVGWAPVPLWARNFWLLVFDTSNIVTPQFWYFKYCDPNFDISNIVTLILIFRILWPQFWILWPRLQQWCASPRSKDWMALNLHGFTEISLVQNHYNKKIYVKDSGCPTMFSWQQNLILKRNYESGVSTKRV